MKVLIGTIIGALVLIIRPLRKMFNNTSHNPVRLIRKQRLEYRKASQNKRKRET